MSSMLAQIDQAVRDAMLAHAADCAPRECCGLLVRIDDTLHYLAAANLAPQSAGRDRFELDPAAWAVEDTGAEVVAVVHSHPNASANPSMADRVGCERSGLPWLIMGWPSGALVEVLPSGWSAPLVRREFAFGVLDCYTLVQDFYQRELGITLPDFERSDGFWERGEHLYRDNLEAAGFEVVATAEPRPGDGVLMRVMSRDVDNHAGVYLGDGLMLHHLYGQLSRVERWDWPWQQRTQAVVRHRTLLGAAPLLRPGLMEELR